MTAFTTRKNRRILPAALILAGVGLAAACNTTTATEVRTAPIACDIAVDEAGRMVTFQGRVQATETVSGSFNLHLTGRGTNIRQGGPFTARAGEIVTLGNSRLSGDADAYDADLSITVNGATYDCASNI